MKRGARREFFSIGEVCRLLAVEPHVLRYWETQFPSLSPSRNRAGNRVYRAADVELASLIRRLVHEEGYTLEGARRRIEELEAGEEAGGHSARALEDSLVRSLRSELEEVLRLLTPAAG